MRGLAKTGALRNGPHNSGGNQAQAIDEREARQVRHDQMQGIRDEGGAQPPGARAPGSDASIGLFDPSDLTPLPKPALETQPQNQPTLLLNGNCSRKSRKGWSVKWDRYFWYMIQFKDHVELRAYASEKAAKAQANTPLTNYSISIDTLSEFRVGANAKDTKAKSNRFAFYLKVMSFMYRYILRESCSQFDSLPLTSLTIFLTVEPLRVRPEGRLRRDAAPGGGAQRAAAGPEERRPLALRLQGQVAHGLAPGAHLRHQVSHRSARGG
jgi:hypothetical protein